MDTQSTPRQSLLIAVMGEKTGVLAQCWAHTEAEAISAVEALFVDTCGVPRESVCIDREAKPGLWIEGNPSYIRQVIRGAA